MTDKRKRPGQSQKVQSKKVISLVEYRKNSQLLDDRNKEIADKIDQMKQSINRINQIIADLQKISKN